MTMLVYLDITSWRGISVGAMHYYGSIVVSSDVPTEIPLMRKITRPAQIELARQDGGDRYLSLYPVGGETERWRSKKLLRKAAVRYFNKHYSIEDSLLIEGSFTTCEPQTVLHGKEPFKSAINELCRQAEECGFWDNEEIMERICSKWETVIAPFR